MINGRPITHICRDIIDRARRDSMVAHGLGELVPELALALLETEEERQQAVQGLLSAQG